mmetsp:Transcript_30834/g.65139  ORF Transcript_30834/g.65139 Transcript_30834/m.65139 type:complete len:255 (+) Transcript_30834:639-1403(+)
MRAALLLLPSTATAALAIAPSTVTPAAQATVRHCAINTTSKPPPCYPKRHPTLAIGVVATPTLPLSPEGPSSSSNNNNNGRVVSTHPVPRPRRVPVRALPRIVRVRRCTIPLPTLGRKLRQRRSRVEHRTRVVTVVPIPVSVARFGLLNRQVVAIIVVLVLVLKQHKPAQTKASSWQYGTRKETTTTKKKTATTTHGKNEAAAAVETPSPPVLNRPNPPTAPPREWTAPRGRANCPRRCSAPWPFGILGIIIPR